MQYPNVPSCFVYNIPELELVNAKILLKLDFMTQNQHFSCISKKLIKSRNKIHRFCWIYGFKDTAGLYFSFLTNDPPDKRS